MFKVIHLVKRQAHLSHEQFREHFERSHAAMALKYCGHLFVEYRRNYVNRVLMGGDPRVADSGFGEREWDWDLLSEWVMAHKAAFAEIQRLMESPELKPLFVADEDRFIARQHIVMMPCTAVCDSGTAFDPANTVFDTPDGVPSWAGYEHWTPLPRGAAHGRNRA